MDSSYGSSRAERYILKIPKRTIEGVLVNSDDSCTDGDNLSCRVRGTDPSLEVLLLQKKKSGHVGLAGCDKNEVCFDPSLPLTPEECREVLRQRIRLPHLFSQSWMIDRTIRELKERTSEEFAVWQQLPQIKGKSILLLDEEGSSELSGYRLFYDCETGLGYQKINAPEDRDL